MRVACAEPGLPTSGRDMWEDWPEDLRALEEVEAEVEVVRVDSGPSDTQGRIAATADADAYSSEKYVNM